jgi:hypothetical protein
MTKTLVEELREAKHLHLETKMLLETAASRIEELERALEIIAGKRPCPDNLMGNADIARQALSGDQQ